MDWYVRYLKFHKMRNPEKMGVKEVAAFLGHLEGNGSTAIHIQNQALNALAFVYSHVLDKPLPELNASRVREMHKHRN
ncbi:MAG: phage integrase N-terminal SAM-like domain-containing protein [Methylacidiphilales bacterium]|nr:phage integrase N-terminal SAM-like domain-containing protein [Candidatus Methylacidiphilales bacterium]